MSKGWKLVVYTDEITTKNRCGLPIELARTVPKKVNMNFFVSHEDKMFIPFACVDNANKLQKIPNLTVTRTITWVSSDGRQTQSTSVATKPDKGGIYWYTKFNAHVLGTITVELTPSVLPEKSGVTDLNAFNIKPLSVSYEVAAGEEGDSDCFDEEDVFSSVNAPTLSRMTLSKEEILHRPMLPATISGPSITLSFSPVHCKVFFDAHAEGVSLPRGVERELPICRPSASEILLKAEKRVRLLDAASSSDSFSKLRAAFEVLFESNLLLEAERQAYTGNIEKLRDDNYALAEFGGAAHLLRLIILVALQSSEDADDEEQESQALKRRKAIHCKVSKQVTFRMQEVANSILREIEDLALGN